MASEARRSAPERRSGKNRRPTSVERYGPLEATPAFWSVPLWNLFEPEWKDSFVIQRITAAALITLGLAPGAALAQNDDKPQPAEPTLITDSHVVGEGDRAMVLVPGLAADERVWLEFMERHKDEFEMHAITLPGFMGSEGPEPADSPSGTPWLNNAVAALEAYIEENDLEEPIVVGHSLGAHIVMKFGIDSDLASRIVAIDGFPVFPLPPNVTEQEKQQMFNMLAAQMARVTDAQWRQQVESMSLTIGDEQTGRKIQEMMLETPFTEARQYVVELYTNDLTPKLSELDEPALVIAALRQTDIPQYFSKETYRLFWTTNMQNAPKAQVVFFEDTGHFVMQDRPEALDRAIEQFLSGEKVDHFTPGDASESGGQ